MLWSCCGPAAGCCGVLWDAAGCCGMLRDAAGCCPLLSSLQPGSTTRAGEGPAAQQRVPGMQRAPASSRSAGQSCGVRRVGCDPAGCSRGGRGQGPASAQRIARLWDNAFLKLVVNPEDYKPRAFSLSAEGGRLSLPGSSPAHSTGSSCLAAQHCPRVTHSCRAASALGAALLGAPAPASDAQEARSSVQGAFVPHSW